MDSLNLKTASAYLNNLLLARGLLRNGKSIEFARPKHGEGGTEATMAQIINLVHDMILRRDREQEQRESLAQTLRTLRSDTTRNTVALERLQTKNEDLTRQLSLAQSQERSTRAALRTAEASARTLREEMVRTKATVHQIRTACANDIRKRDVQIQRLKTHLTAQQRGNRTGLVGASITITPGATEGIGNMNKSNKEDVPGVEDAEYSLRQETTEFLTQLSQSLSDENDNLIGLVRSALTTLRELQGLPENAGRAGLPDIAEDEATNEHMFQALPTSYDSFAMDMHSVLDNLRTLLTNPNFVPIEEVSVREEEILRLRDGWEKMEARWREAIAMMDGWRKRMVNGGDTVNLEELKLGLGLGEGLSSVTVQNGALSDTDTPEDDGIEDADTEPSFQSLGDDDEEVDMISTEVKLGEPLNRELHQQQQPLQEGHGNSKSPRKVAFISSKANSPAVHATKLDENGKTLNDIPTPSLKRPDSRHVQPKSQTSTEIESRIPRKALKRLSSPGPHSAERSPKLTTQEKLNIAQAEAEAAGVAGDEVNELEVNFDSFREDTARRVVKTRKAEARATKIGGRPRRRKSTLSPEELEKLMFD